MFHKNDLENETHKNDPQKWESQNSDSEKKTAKMRLTKRIHKKIQEYETHKNDPQTTKMFHKKWDSQNDPQKCCSKWHSKNVSQNETQKMIHKNETH